MSRQSSMTVFFAVIFVSVLVGLSDAAAQGCGAPRNKPVRSSSQYLSSIPHYSARGFQHRSEHADTHGCPACGVKSERKPQPYLNQTGNISERKTVRSPMERGSVRTPVEQRSVKTPVGQRTVQTPAASHEHQH